MTRGILALLLVLLATGIGQAQQRDVPVIDSIVVLTRDVFEPQEEAMNPVFGVMNALHVTTRASVVRRELLFKVGQPLDSARLYETERNLRRVGLFRRVVIEPRQVNGKLVVYVVTSDGWSTTLGLNARSTGGVFTWSTNFSEGNLAGTGNTAGIGYRKDVDRTAWTGSAGVPRIGRTGLRTAGLYDRLSDGHTAQLFFGAPYRAFSDRRVFDAALFTARRRILQFRDGFTFRSFQQRVFRTSFSAGFAPIASPRGYFRIGATTVIKNEEYLRAADTLLVIPDTVSAAVGVGVDWRRSVFIKVNHLNGFARDEDVDLGSRIQAGAWLAPSGFGYPSSGIGPYLDAQTGWRMGRTFIRLTGRINGLFNAAGLDSGHVFGTFTAASQLLPRQATVLLVAGGLEHDVPGGFEFDLGHGVGPRSFGPHAFTGTQTVYGTLEHRIFAIDELGGFMGVGFALFADYGAAWYRDERMRKGGDIGLGLRLGATRATGSSVGRFDFGYRLGDGITGGRWVFSFGRSTPI